MKKLLLVTALLAISCSALALASVRQAPDGETLILRVTSSNPNEEVVCEASYLFHEADSQLQHVERVTPFEIRAHTDFAAGIFRKKTGGGNLVVTMPLGAGEKETGYIAGEGDVIVLGTAPGGGGRFSLQNRSLK
jgi:hypothetical protein